jgi:hypothetical protein
MKTVMKYISGHPHLWNKDIYTMVIGTSTPADADRVRAFAKGLKNVRRAKTKKNNSVRIVFKVTPSFKQVINPAFEMYRIINNRL